MKQEISLLDMKKNEMGRLIVDTGELKLFVADNFSHLGLDLNRLLDHIKQIGAFTVRKSVKKDGAVLEVEEKISIDHSAYMGAVADFINKSKLRSPRIFAVLRQIPGGEK